MNEVEMEKTRRGEQRRRKGLSVFRLKVIGAIFMALNVASVAILPTLVGDPSQDMAALTAVVLCAAASWIAVPIYSWLLFDGYRHTHNPVFGLLIALVVLALVDWLAKKYHGAFRWTLTVLVIIAGLLWDLLLHVGVDQRVLYTGVLTLSFVRVFYFLNARENSMMFTAGLLGAVMCITPAIGVAFLHYRNGEQDFKQPWTKWAFYVIYPVLLVFGALVAA